MQRYLSIDILRGIAIILMVQVHFVDNLSSREIASGWLYDLSMFLGAFSAPAFTFLSGVSYFLWVRKQESLGLRDKPITRGTLRRGLFLFVLGLVFNFCIWLPEETFNWDILTLLGTSYLLLAYARKLPLPVLALICVLIGLISPVLRFVGDYTSYWEDNNYTYDFTVRDVTFGFFVTGYFPLFPWLVFPLAGYACGDWLFRRRPEMTRWRACALGVAFLGLAGADVLFRPYVPHMIARHYATGLSEFPATTEHLLTMLGLILICLIFLHRWLDRPAPASPPTGRLITVLSRFSAFSLTVYLLHHMVLLWPLWLYGAWTGHEDSTVFWRRAMSTSIAFALAVAFLIVCHILLLVLDRHRKYSLESIMRRTCDGRDPAPMA